MDANTVIMTLLRRLADGAITPAECGAALQKLERHVHVGDYARLDPGRRARTGFPEVVYAPGKAEDELRGILQSLRSHGQENILVSRLPAETYQRLTEEDWASRYYTRSSTAVFGMRPPESLLGSVAIVTAGTSDLAAAEEAELACIYAGSSVQRFADVGVASIERLLQVVPDIARCNVCICVAGMEAALPSVLAGLLSLPVIGLPTSVGYGVNDGGINALLSMLGSCAPGVMTVNIDNGIGAAAAAHRINRLIQRHAHNEHSDDV
ncbi:MAG: nickel pincer cofactor biosynthesis protein LarB [Bacteroidota bacterium]|nr:nickel pincer cofactor biosynthesis protein LarB [Bacteroidota bacterium]